MVSSIGNREAAFHWCKPCLGMAGALVVVVIVARRMRLRPVA